MLNMNYAEVLQCLIKIQPALESNENTNEALEAEIHNVF